MNINKKIIVLVPARSGSKGFKNKNLAMLKDIPLVAWPIIAASKSKLVSSIYLSTDSKEIAEIGEKYGAKVPWLRPDHLASDSATRSEVILHAINNLDDFDYLVYLEPTSPLTTDKDIDDALRLLIQTENAQSLVSICKHSTHHPDYTVTKDKKNIISPLMHKSFHEIPVNRQDLDDCYFFDGSIYITTKRSFLENKEFLTDNTIGFEVDERKSLEIDSSLDLELIKIALGSDE
tara:strand:- start:350 stop:1051 length:702 start_codon:yes stop_codon:yes gene_type:complete